MLRIILGAPLVVALLLLIAALLSGCKVVLEVTQDATIEGRPAICHRIEGAKQWMCDPK